MDNPWNGGGGYSTEEVAQMTLDGIWARLTDVKTLRRGSGRVENLKGLQAVSSVGNKDGSINVKSASGQKVKLVTRGKSKARAIADGTYEGWVINDMTGKREYLTPRNKDKSREK